MPEPLHIRPIESADVPTVHNLVERTALRFVIGDLEAQGRASLQEYNGIAGLRERMQRGHHQWVAQWGNQIVGVVEVRDLNHVSMLYVDPSRHRQGVGRQLLATALAECKRKPSVAKVTVNSSRYAQAFYTRHGFEPDGEETITNGVISIPMTLDLHTAGPLI